MNHSQLSDEALVALLQAGEARAYEAIYKRYWYKMYSIAYHQTGVRQEAEELVQNVFLSVWNRRTEVVIRHLDLYLTLAVKNQVYDFIKSRISYRKFQEYQILQEINQHYNPHELMNFTELAQAVEKVLRLLPEKSAEVFRRSRFENQSVRDIAEGLQLSEKAVEYHITKSLKFLKENLGHYRSDN